MKFPSVLLLAVIASVPLRLAAEVWTVRVEEPTGLYPRTNEVVAVPYAKIGGKRPAWSVVDTQGKELPWQATDDALLFPATLIPGELPEYRIAASADTKTNFVNQIHLRKIGMNRVELGNRFFRILIDTHSGAIIEVFNLTAATNRILNLVETTPEDPAALKDDIHAAEAMGFKPVPGVPEGNPGWTSLGATGAMTKIEFIENGPLRGKVRLERTCNSPETPAFLAETWELTWSSDSRALIWRIVVGTPTGASPGKRPTESGFRFTAISASPYLPFDRCVEGSDYNWPNGPDEEEPPNHEVTPRQWPKLPGGHAIYYHHAENYGALGIVALDTNLNWTGAGSRRFIAELPASTEQSPVTTEVALTFPEWHGSNTVLEARREYRILRQPVLIHVQKSASDSVSIEHSAERAAEIALDIPAEAPKPFQPEAISLDGEWELAWCEKGRGPPTNGWRKVKVPGSAHTQWLEPSKIYSRDAEWISYKEWWYRRSFEVPSSFAGRRLRLQFEATDYYADAWLNDARLGRHEGYMDPYEYDVGSQARVGGANELLVRTWAPVNYYWKHRSYTIKGAYGAVEQKPDDITPLGITRPVRLLASDAVVIKDVAIDTRLSGNGSAEVEVEVEFDGTPDSASKIELTLSPRNFSSPERHRAQAPVTGHSIRIVIPVKNPQLWWTADHGKPNLYTLDVRLRDDTGRVLDGRSMAVGIREIERVGWTFYLNRRRMFIRGTNYYYHLYLSEMNRAAYERDLKLMMQMNINLIRLHCHFSNPEFYDVADELGVLIWQDYLEAWYQEDRAFSLRAAALYDPLIRSVRNHPCVASWTTCDEESLENYRDRK